MPRSVSSQPRAAAGWAGAMQSVEAMRTPVRPIRALAERATSWGILMILDRLMETATKMRPVSAADAPASVEKKVDQADGLYADPMAAVGSILAGGPDVMTEMRRAQGRLTCRWLLGTIG